MTEVEHSAGGARCSSVVRWVVGLILHGVDPLSYFSFQPDSKTGVTKTVVCVVLSVGWNGSMGPPWRIDPTTHRTMSECSYHGATCRYHREGSIRRTIAPWANALTTELHVATTVKDRSDDPSHHEQMLLPRSYISLHHEGSIRWPIAPCANALTMELHLTPPWRIDPTTHRTMSECSYHGATCRYHHEGSIRRPIAPWANALTTELHVATTVKDRSDDPSHHERMLWPWSYMSLIDWMVEKGKEEFQTCYFSVDWH